MASVERELFGEVTGVLLTVNYDAEVYFATLEESAANGDHLLDSQVEAAVGRTRAASHLNDGREHFYEFDAAWEAFEAARRVSDFLDGKGVKYRVEVATS